MESIKETVYKSAENYIIELIKTRNLGRNDSIPSQREIGMSIGSSQFSVRRAMDNLVTKGVLKKTQGRYVLRFFSMRSVAGLLVAC